MALNELLESTRPMLNEVGTAAALGAATYVGTALGVGIASRRTSVGEQLRGGIVPTVVGSAAAGLAFAYDVQAPESLEAAARYTGAAIIGGAGVGIVNHFYRSGKHGQNFRDNVRENVSRGAVFGAALIPTAYWLLNFASQYQ